jgi:hypothetical protein
MSEHAWRLPFSPDPLIAEAKRRARQRRALLALMVVLVLGGGGTALAVRPFGWFRTSRPYAGPYEPSWMFTGTGGPIPLDSWPKVQAVSAASRSDAWIVGSVARRWDGHAWRNVPLPPTGGSELWAVAAVAPSDAWAVGWLGTDPYRALIEHWNGARWSIAQLPRLRQAMLFGVSAAGPRSAWAVGATRTYRRHGAHSYPVTHPLLLHWDGTSWRRQPLPWAYPGLALDKVVATGPSSVWVISSGAQDSLRPRIEHWNGRSWRLVYEPFGSNDPLAGFTATAGNDAWAVGSYGLGGNTVVKNSHALAAHWNGRHWQIRRVPNPPGGSNSAVLIDVAAAGPGNVWALGLRQHLDFQGHDVLSGTGPTTYFLHWNGRDWRVTSGTTPLTYDGSTAITATPDGSAWAIGNCYLDDFSVRWTGDTWVTAPHPRDTHWRDRGPTVPPKARRGPPPSCSSSTTSG